MWGEEAEDQLVSSQERIAQFGITKTNKAHVLFFILFQIFPDFRFPFLYNTCFRPCLHGVNSTSCLAVGSQCYLACSDAGDGRSPSKKPLVATGSSHLFGI